MDCRHPKPLSRPSFKDIINSLLGDESQVLQIPIRDASTHEAAIILGGPLEAGNYLYRDLQTEYDTSTARRPRTPVGDSKRTAKRSSDYDHIPGRQAFMTAFPTSSADIDHMYNRQKGQRSSSSSPQSTPNAMLKSSHVCSVDSDLDSSSVTSFRQRLLTDDRGSDYEDIGD